MNDFLNGKPSVNPVPNPLSLVVPLHKTNTIPFMQFDRQHFEAIYSRFLDSGLKAFCCNEGLHPSKFYYWQKRIRPASHPLVRNGFLPLTIDSPAYDSSSGGYSGMEQQLEITYPDGTTLRLRGCISVKEILTSYCQIINTQSVSHFQILKKRHDLDTSQVEIEAKNRLNLNRGTV